MKLTCLPSISKDAKPRERRLINHISRAPLPPLNDSSKDDDWMDLDDLEPIQYPIPVSHSGGELESLQELQEEIMNLSGKRYVYLLFVIRF
jgi:hypothetical protein